jgi:DNA-directed RNA polymerase specialized sigma24 family protein
MSTLATATEQLVELDGFRGLLARLDPDPLKAWQAHEDLRRKLIAYFEYNHHVEAEELAEEALDRIAKRPDLQTLGNVVEFAFGVARNLRKENLRQTSRRIDIPDLEAVEDTMRWHGSAEDAILDRISEERKRQCFYRCMQFLSVEEREMVRRYYPPENADLEGERMSLAAHLGLKVGALRTRMARIKEKLQDDFNRQYYGAPRPRSIKGRTERGNVRGAKDSTVSGRYNVGTVGFEVETLSCSGTSLRRREA